MRDDNVVVLLSSDDEAFPNIASSPKGFTSSPFAKLTKPRVTNDYKSFLHEDDFLDTNPPKRRRTSPQRPFRTADQPPGAMWTFAGVDQDMAMEIERARVGEPGNWHVLEDDETIDYDSDMGMINVQGMRESQQGRGPSDCHFSGDDSDSLPDDPWNLPLKPSNNEELLSVKTADLLAGLSKSAVPRAQSSQPERKPKDCGGKAGQGASKARSTSILEEATSQEVDGTAPKKISKSTQRTRLNDEEKAARAKAKEEKKAANALARKQAKEIRAKTKEDELERKRKLREQQAREKQRATEIEEVNRATLDKSETTREMIVDLPTSIADQKIDRQTRDFLQKHCAEASTYQSSVPNVVKWRRKVKAVWNEESQRWEPLPDMRIDNEKHILCYMHADDFISLAISRNDQDLDSHVTRLKSSHPDCTLIYLIDGFDRWMQQNKNAENRAYQAKVMAQAFEDETGPQPAKSRKRAAREFVDKDNIEDALLRLQLQHSCLVQHAKDTVDSAMWILIFTQHISTNPYR